MRRRPPPRKKVLLVGDRRRAGVLQGVERHRRFLARAVEIVEVDLDGRVDLARARADLVLVFGGDGSVLHVARRLGRNPLPVLGVNYGRFGWLTDVEPDAFEAGIGRWLEGAFSVARRLRLSVRVHRGRRPSAEALALNDVVVARDHVGAMVDLAVRIDGRPGLGIAGDGLIVATSTGSTAHALSAGGPVLEPSVEACVLVPLAPHSLAHRPIVLPAAHRLELVLDAGRHPGRVSVDGDEGRPLRHGDVVQVEDARAPLHLVQVSATSFYDALRHKLGWTGRPAALAQALPGRLGAPEPASAPRARARAGRP